MLKRHLILNLFCAGLATSAAFASSSEEEPAPPVKRANAHRVAPVRGDFQLPDPLPQKKATKDIKIECSAPVIEFQNFGNLQIDADGFMQIIQYLDPKSLYNLTLTKKSVLPFVGKELISRVPQLVKEWQEATATYRELSYKYIVSDLLPPYPVFILENFNHDYGTIPCPALSELLSSSKPMLNVALLLEETLDPTLKTIANNCSLQSPHLILNKFKYRIACSPLDSFFKEWSTDGSYPQRQIAIKTKTSLTFERLINQAQKIDELNDIFCNSLAYAKIFTYPPSLDNGRAAAKYLMQIEDFMYFDPAICNWTLANLYLGPKAISFDYTLYLYNMPLNLSNYTDRSLDQKCDDFDLFRNLYIHMTLKLGIVPQKLTHNGCWEGIKPALMNNAQNKLFKERHLDRHFK